MTTSYWNKVKKLVNGLWTINKDYFQKELAKRKIYNIQTENILQLHDQVHKEYQPCFVLSTGRCGTSLLTKILNKHSDIIAYHNPIPELSYHNGYAYYQDKSRSEELKAMIDSARYELIRDNYLLRKLFVETNPRITFFAHQLSEIYPKAKFIHLYRHPLEVVASGVSRKWYMDNSIREEGRIEGQFDKWVNFNQAQKVAWLWQATNQFAEDFKTTIDPSRTLTVQAEELFSEPEITVSIFNHLSVLPLSNSVIKKLIKKPVNKQYRKKSLSVNEKQLLTLTPLVKQYYMRNKDT